MTTTVRTPAPSSASLRPRPAVAPKAAAPSNQPTSGPRWNFGDLALQPSLEVGAIDDPREREAEAVADRVIRMPNPAAVGAMAPGVQRACENCAAKEESGPGGNPA